MITYYLGIPEHPFAVFITLAVVGFSFFLVLAALSHAFFFKWKKQRFHPDYKPDIKQIRQSLKWSAYSIGGNALLMLPLHMLIIAGHSQVYYRVDDYGWPWLITSALLILLISETMTYWIHRALHGKWLFKHIHKPHHDFRVPTPWAGVAFNPLDSFAQAFPHHLCVFLFPVHAGVYTLFISFVTVWAVMIHDRLSFMPWRGINYTGHHTLHHWYYNCNYGQFFTFWDRIGGTYRDPEEVHDRIPKSVLRPHITRGWFKKNQPSKPAASLPDAHSALSAES